MAPITNTAFELIFIVVLLQNWFIGLRCGFLLLGASVFVFCHHFVNDYPETKISIPCEQWICKAYAHENFSDNLYHCIAIHSLI